MPVLRERLLKNFLVRRGVPAQMIAELEKKAGIDSSFWEFLLKFLVEYGLPALLEFLRRILDDVDGAGAAPVSSS